MDATTIAVDLAKSSFEVAFADHRDRIIKRRRLTRAQFRHLLEAHAPADVIMEACGTAHYWGRLAQAAGHRVTLLPAQYVRPFVRRQKTDRTDVAGLIDACGRAGVHPVSLKTVPQQELVALHRIRAQWQQTRTARINAIRGLLQEHGIVLPAGAHQVGRAVQRQVADADTVVPGRLRRLLTELVTEIAELETRIDRVDHELADVARHDEEVQRLDAIPGIGLITATALVGSVAKIHTFRRARSFASWLGLTAREHSSGPRRRLGAITKQGDSYLRCLLVHGARAVLRRARQRAARHEPLTRLQHWAHTVAVARGFNRAAVALANKLARIVWAVWSRGTPYVAAPAAA
jgi:transposase